MILQDSISAVCRWLSVYGWSNGVRSLLTPTDFRVRVGEGMCIFIYGEVLTGSL